MSFNLTMLHYCAVKDFPHC